MPPDVTSLVQTRATLAVGREEATATAPEGRDEEEEARAQVRIRRTQGGRKMHPNEAAAYAMIENGDSKFYMFWRKGLFTWYGQLRPGPLQDPGHGSCFVNDYDNDKRGFMQDPTIDTAKAAGKNYWEWQRYASCDYNWALDSCPECGGADDRPFTMKGGGSAALFGMDWTIKNYCRQALGLPEIERKDFTGATAPECVKANQNILRFHANDTSMDMCVDTQWVMCALRGRLPGQKYNEIAFTQNIGNQDEVDLTLRNTDPFVGDWLECTWLPPKDYPHNFEDIPIQGPCYAIYYMELSIVNYVCANSHEMWKTPKGGTFKCTIDEDAYNQLGRALMDGHGASKAFSELPNDSEPSQTLPPKIEENHERGILR